MVYGYIQATDAAHSTMMSNSMVKSFFAMFTIELFTIELDIMEVNLRK